MTAATSRPPPLVVTLPLRTVSIKNKREHWAKRAKRTKEHRKVTAWAVVPRLTSVAWQTATATALVVTLVRLAPRRLDDDNVRIALSACRDGIADALGVNDNDPRVEWRYSQHSAGPGVYAVRIEIEAA